MRVASAFAIFFLSASTLIADTRHIEADESVDFSAFRTFVVQEGRVASRNAEINNGLLLKKIQDAIRLTLSSRGLRESQDRPDLTVTFSLAEKGQRGVVGRGLRNVRVISTSEGTLVIEMTSRNSNSLVWYGIYTDDEADAAKLSKKLPEDAKKLMSDYPPKKKR